MRLRILIPTRIRTLELLALSFILLASSPVWANSGGGHEKPAEAAKEGGEHGAAPKEDKNAPKTCRYSEHESRLTSLTARIRSFEKEISDMIDAKKHLEHAEKVHELTQQITFKHLDLAKAVREYESERLHMRFQHPDRDMEGAREYPRQTLKSLKDLEQAFGLDGRLDRIKNHVGVVFPSQDPGEKLSEHGARGIASEPDDDDRPPERIRLSK